MHKHWTFRPQYPGTNSQDRFPYISLNLLLLLRCFVFRFSHRGTRKTQRTMGRRKTRGEATSRPFSPPHPTSFFYAQIFIKRAMILLLLRPAFLTHKNPQRRKIIDCMRPVELKDRSIGLKTFL